MRSPILLALTFLAAIPCTPAQTVIHQISGNSAFGGIGHGVAGINDIDGDGVSDFVTAGIRSQSGVLSSYLRYYSGRDGAVIDTVQVGPSITPQGTDLRASLASCGDLDGDGATDTIMGVWEVPVGTAFPSINGTACVVSSGTRALLFAVNGLSLADDFGSAVAGAGDVNGDGAPDVIVGSPQETLPSPGYFQVFNGLNGQFLFGFAGSGAGFSVFGRSVAGAGDFDNDNVDDVVIGNPVPSGGGNGQVVVVSGANQSFLLNTAGGPTTGLGIGEQVAGVGDLNNDGFDDIATTTRGAAFPVTSSQLNVYLGGSGNQLYSVTLGPFPAMGQVMRTIGDVDGDGHRDLVLGAGFGAQQLFSPIVVSALTGVTVGTIPGPNSFNTLQALDSIDDVNGDGLPEILIGTPVGAGEVRVVSYATLPAATTTGLGQGYAPPGMANPALFVTAPRLGDSWTVQLTTFLPNTMGWMVMGPTPASPLQPVPGLTVYPNLLAPQDWMLVPFFTDPAGSHTAHSTVPWNHGLAGLGLVFQAYFPSPSGLSSASLSNGVTVIFGY